MNNKVNTFDLMRFSIFFVTFVEYAAILILSKIPVSNIIKSTMQCYESKYIALFISKRHKLCVIFLYSNFLLKGQSWIFLKLCTEDSLVNIFKFILSK